LSPEFTKTEISQSSNLGALLREKREALGFSIKEVELSIRIRSKYIECLEKGLYSSLPNDVYVKGFLKNYADFLQLEYSDILSMYQKEKDLTISKPKKSKSKSKKINNGWALTPKTLIIALIILGAFSVAGFIYWQFRIFAAPPSLEIISPKNNYKTQNGFVDLKGSTNPGSLLFINEVEVQHKEGNFNQRISLLNGTNLLKIKSVNKLGKSTEKSLVIVADIPETGEITGNSGHLLEVSIAAGDLAISVDISLDGGTKIHRFLMPKTSEKFSANEKVFISSTDPKNTLVTVSSQNVIDAKMGLAKWNQEENTLSIDINQF
jgi:hypothetical protein